MVQRGAGSRRGGIGGREDAGLCMGGARAVVRGAARGGFSFGACGQQLATGVRLEWVIVLFFGLSMFPLSLD
ncbi:hypothetical protein E2562_010481 [Oryza meyeriana var. granulata]|uniref:Uncharacterized protein n=1 Tax=Oryza meyeriana var. granulata TaxID=110450 RepID=A0A6G1F6Q7_9ORYZ|nr:hypothetical protein E2562_010481 [Oryza meyeriana var. granulata]